VHGGGGARVQHASERGKIMGRGESVESVCKRDVVWACVHDCVYPCVYACVYVCCICLCMCLPR
jgi:hypothetical protein